MVLILQCLYTFNYPGLLGLKPTKYTEYTLASNDTIVVKRKYLTETRVTL